jgi:cell division protein FtsB
MAATYQGARPRSGFIGSGGRRSAFVQGATLAPPVTRRRSRTAVRAGRRSGRVGLVLGGIVIAFLLAFFWLVQNVRLTTTGYDIAALQAERDRLDATTQDLITNIQRLGSGPAIRKEALDAGLDPLAAPIVIPAH